MARRKPKPPAVVINNLEQADEVLREMCQWSRAIEVIQQQMNTSIDEAKTEAKALAAVPLARLAELEESLAAYASYQSGELFKSKKTVTVTFGSFGFRKSTALKPEKKGSWEKVLEMLKSLKMPEAIRTTEEVDKEVLQGWTDERLATVGARRVPTDKFWCEVDTASLSDEARP